METWIHSESATGMMGMVDTVPSVNGSVMWSKAVAPDASDKSMRWSFSIASCLACGLTQVEWETLRRMHLSYEGDITHCFSAHRVIFVRRWEFELFPQWLSTFGETIGFDWFMQNQYGFVVMR